MYEQETSALLERIEDVPETVRVEELRGAETDPGEARLELPRRDSLDPPARRVDELGNALVVSGDQWLPLGRR